jgi:hypothetical protein
MGIRVVIRTEANPKAFTAEAQRTQRMHGELGVGHSANAVEKEETFTAEVQRAQRKRRGPREIRR